MQEREQSAVVIVGAGHAGGSAAALLRQSGYAGAVTLIGEEPVPSYQRPPLSKAWLEGEANADSVALKPGEFYTDNGIDFRAGARVAIYGRMFLVESVPNALEQAKKAVAAICGA